MLYSAIACTTCKLPVLSTYRLSWGNKLLSLLLLLTSLPGPVVLVLVNRRTWWVNFHSYSHVHCHLIVSLPLSNSKSFFCFCFCRFCPFVFSACCLCPWCRWIAWIPNPVWISDSPRHVSIWIGLDISFKALLFSLFLSRLLSCMISGSHRHVSFWLALYFLIKRRCLDWPFISWLKDSVLLV